MSYFSRISNRMLGSDVKNVTRAITTDQIPETFEIKRNSRTPWAQKLDRDVESAEAVTPKVEDIEEQQLSPRPRDEDETEKIDPSTTPTTPKAPTKTKTRSITYNDDTSKKKIDNENLKIEGDDQSEKRASSGTTKSDMAINIFGHIRNDIGLEYSRPKGPVDYESGPKVQTNNRLFKPKALPSKSSEISSIEQPKENLVGEAVNEGTKKETQKRLSVQAGKSGIKAAGDIASKHEAHPIHEENHGVSIPIIMPSNLDKTSNPHQIQSNTPPETIVTVNIGRIEIRAFKSKETATRHSATFTPRMTITEYIKQREGVKQ